MEEKEKMEEAESCLIYKRETDNIGMGACCATDMVHNQKLHLPQLRPAGEEAVLGTRLGIWKRYVDEYVTENYREGGVLKSHNLTDSERLSLIKPKRELKVVKLLSSSQVDRANKEVEAKGHNICVGSGDVMGLYPSLRHRDFHLTERQPT